MIISFKEWLKAQESSAFTRSRTAAANGTGPDIPAASIHSRSTASQAIVDKLDDKPKKKKKSKKKDLTEGKKNPVKNAGMDNFLKAIADLKTNVDEVKKKSKEDKKKVTKEPEEKSDIKVAKPQNNPKCKRKG